MSFELSKLTKISNPATEQEICESEQSLKTVLPEIYKEFLRSTNGGKSEDSIYFYSTEDILERNITFEINEYLPDYILIGDDGGGRGIFMRASKNSTSVIMVGLGSLSEEDFEEISSDLQKWIEFEIVR